MRVGKQLRNSYVGFAIVCLVVVLLWGLRSLITAQPEVPVENHILSISWSPDTTQVAIGYEGGRIETVSLASPMAARILQDSTGLSDVYALAWSPDGQMLASGTSQYIDVFTVWDVGTGEPILLDEQLLEDISFVIWGPSDKEVLVMAAEPRNGGFSSIRLNVMSNDVRGVPVGYVVSANLNADGTKLVVGSAPGQIVVIDGLLLEPIAEYTIDNTPFRNLINQPVTVRWNLDSTQIAVGMGDGRVLILSNQNPRTLELVATLIAHEYEGRDYLTGFVHDLSYTPDGSRLTSVSGDGTIRTWDTSTWEIIANSSTVPNYAAEFTPYGGRLAVGAVLGESDARQADAAIVTTLVEGQLQIVVPNPSLELLNSISADCIEPSASRTLPPAADLTTLPEFVAEVEALPEDAIPPACRADLLAVAEAIMAEQ